MEASATKLNSETYPLGEIVRFEFPVRGSLPPVTLTWYDGGLKPARPAELADDDPMLDIIYVGSQGKLMSDRLIPESRMGTYWRPPKTLREPLPRKTVTQPLNYFLPSRPSRLTPRSGTPSISPTFTPNPSAPPPTSRNEEPEKGRTSPPHLMQIILLRRRELREPDRLRVEALSTLL